MKSLPWDVSLPIECVRQVSEVASHINEHIKQQDNFMKMAAIQRSLVGSAAPRIITPGRIFIKEGVLHKVGEDFIEFDDKILVHACFTI